MTETMRLRTLENPDGTWVYVVDELTGGQAYQDEFARQLARFGEYVRERSQKCVGVLVFHDRVELPQVDPVPLEFPGMEPVQMEADVSVCAECRAAADSNNPDRPHCPVCSRQIEVYRNDLPEDEQTLYSHGDGEGGRCDGSKGTPVYRPVGHCSGKCPCQHRRKGAWRGGPAH